MLGHDADSTATMIGSWVGALHGESGLPREWVDTVCQVNIRRLQGFIDEGIPARAFRQLVRALL
jgi:ADP-ribosylglycohydrolase